MRAYGAVSPLFWSGETGKKLRAAGRDSQLVALYLVTGPSSNMCGIYHLPLPTLCHHTGMSEQDAKKAILAVQSTGFCKWDENAEVVFVPMNAKYQVGETLKENDKRRSGIMRELLQFKKSSFVREFLTIYGVKYGVAVPDFCSEILPEGASKGLTGSDSKPISPLEGAYEKNEFTVLVNDVDVALPLKGDARGDERAGDPVASLAQKAAFLSGKGTSTKAVADWHAHISDLIAAGIPATAIEIDLNATKSPAGGKRSEPPWEFKARLLKANGKEPDGKGKQLSNEEFLRIAGGESQ